MEFSRTVSFAGQDVPAIGMGTWYMGEGLASRAQEADALRAGLDAGLRVVDTAEMYADGGAEEVVGDALAGRRDDAVLVSKVYPYNATRDGVRQACERSLRRLRTDHVDVYLLHWRGQVPLEETVEGFEDLVSDGLIGGWGVSNLDHDDLRELFSLPGGDGCLTDQILYNLTRRGPEYDLLPMAADHDIPIMAYSPVEQARLLDGGPHLDALEVVAERHRATPAQVALAWCIRDENTIAIPKAATLEHVRENAAALEIDLTADDLATLDATFPPPTAAVPLQML